jgi:4-amino-4-deoxy-L-arabinose transferase-like glycosyltransferase
MDAVKTAPAPVVAQRHTPPTARSTRRELGRLLLVFLALTMLLRLPAFFVDVFNSDETFLATQAEVLRHGGEIYRDAADRKPPLVPFIYAGTFELFGTSDLWTVRVAAMVAAALTAFLVALEARPRYGRRAGWAAGLLCVFALIAFAPQDGQAANFEIFMLPPMIAAIMLARRGRAGASGIAVAVATLAKQTGALTLLPVYYLVWKKHGRSGLAWATIGFFAPLAFVAVLIGPGQVLYWTVLGNGSYVSVETLSSYVIGLFAVMTLGYAACNVPILWRLRPAWRARLEPTRDGDNDLDLWVWLASAVVSVMIGLRFFGHYYFQLVPPLCLLTAGALSRGSRTVARLTLAVAAIGALGFSAAGYFLHPFGGEPSYKIAANYIEANSTPSDRVLVWGNVPEIYHFSNRLPATRFIGTTTLLSNVHPGRPAKYAAPEESDPEAWKWFFEDLGKRPPKFIVDTAPAKIRGAEYTPLDRFPRLKKLVDRHYHQVRTIDHLRVYERDGD